MRKSAVQKFHIAWKSVVAIVLCIVSLWMLYGCGQKSSGSSESSGSSGSGESSGRSAKTTVLVPEAPGTNVIGVDGKVGIDISNVNNGYITVNYTGDNDKVKLQITSGEQTYTYDLKIGEADVFPLTGGDGTYEFSVLEHLAGTEKKYKYLFTGTAEVKLENEFEPFLYPNQYVDFTPESLAVKQGEELAQGAKDDFEVVERIYNYAVENISYDTDKADLVQTQSGYLPDVDETLQTKKGICFDYAALMSAMLRTQGIPTRLVIGYVSSGSGEQLYHAWISVYIEGEGWIDNIIYFDGTDWVRMDPTLASTSGEETRYTGDGNQYNALYYY